MKVKFIFISEENQFHIFLGISYKSLAEDRTIEKRHEWTEFNMGQSLGTKEKCHD